MLYKSYKTELKLNNTQIDHCKQHAGTARFTYNWGLAKKKEAMEKSVKMWRFRTYTDPINPNQLVIPIFPADLIDILLDSGDTWWPSIQANRIYNEFMCDIKVKKGKSIF